eukprot:scaffold114094_cov57-Phaeocystis_antarctica.AAC.4
MRQGPSQPSKLPCIPPPSSFLEGSQHRPARALNATGPAFPACVSRMSPARAQPTHSLDIQRAHCLLAAAPTPSPLPPTPANPARTAATPSFAHGWVACARVHPPACTCSSQAEFQQLRRRRRAGPQSGRAQRAVHVPKLMFLCLGGKSMCMALMFIKV